VNVDEFVARNLTQLRAPLKRSTVFGPAGRWVRRRTGERILFGPDGRPFLVRQYIDGGTAVEHGNDRRSAVVRPVPTIVKLNKQ